MHFINKSKSSYYFKIYFLNEILYPHFFFLFNISSFSHFNISNNIAPKDRYFSTFNILVSKIFSGNYRILQYQFSPYWQFNLSFPLFLKWLMPPNKSIIKEFFSGKMRDFAHMKAILPIDGAAGMKNMYRQKCIFTWSSYKKKLLDKNLFNFLKIFGLIVHMIMSSLLGIRRKSKEKFMIFISCPSLGGKERRVVKSTCDDLLLSLKKSTKSYNGSFSFESI